jgi:hypothetical protein
LTTSPKPDLLASKFSELNIGSVLTAAALGLFAIFDIWFYQSRGKSNSFLAYGIWAIVSAVGISAAAALAGLSRSRARWSDGERARLLILTVLGWVGLTTALLGLALPFAYPEIFGGPLKVWREHMGTVMLCVGVLFGGMLVMFVGLVLARGYSVQFPNLRRVVYGYNAILGASLLFCILGLINLLPYVQLAPFKYLSKTYDWTTAGIFSLEPQSKNILDNLKEPVKVYVMLPPPERDPVTADVETLLNNCRSETSQLSWQTVSRDFNLDEMRNLYKKYQLPDSLGLLVTYGTEPNASSEFIRRSDLVDDRSTADSARYSFKGESALLNAITYLAQGKAKTTVYFTQGYGEPALETRNFERAQEGLTTLKDDLEKRNYQAKPLNLGVDTKTIPDDADVVAIMAPTQPYADNVVKALRDYMHGEGGRKKGRLLVLLGPAQANQGRMPGQSLESLLAEFDVQADRNHIIAARPRDPLEVEAIMNPESTNTLAKAFVQGGQATVFYFHDVRTVGPLNRGQPGASTFKVEPLLLALPRYPIWAESNLDANPQALQAEARADVEQLIKKASRTPLTIAVSVSEGQGMPPIPGHPPVSSESQPRLIVFGTGGWVTNSALSRRGGADYLDLFTSSLGWLRERADLGAAASGKSRDEYRLPPPSDGGWRLVVLPAGMLLVCVIMLGCGIWVVRRR